MPALEETIRRLSASFADEIIAALRNVPLDELLALSADGDVAAEAKPATARSKARRARTSTPRRADEAADARPLPKPLPERSREAPAAATIDAAERVFAERGARGATVVQLGDALAAQGVPGEGVVDEVIRVLVERELIRDAGFRRTTGQGTAPVFVSCRRDLHPLKTGTDAVV